MTKQGILKVSMGVSRLNGTRLAREGANNPFGAATTFLANRGLSDGDFIWVEGSDGFVGNVAVIFITSAGLATDESSVSATRSIKKKAKRTGANKVKSSGRKKSSKKKSPKQAPRKIRKTGKKTAK